MALTTYLSYNLAPKQRILYTKASGTTVAFIPYSISHFAGTPGSVSNPVTQATTAAGGTAPGLLVTPLNKSGGFTLKNNGGQKYITQIAYHNTAAGNLQIYDKILEYAISPLSLGTISCANINMGSRNYPNFQNLIFLEIGSAISATATTVFVTYTNGENISGRISPSVNISGLPIGRWVAIPLQSGDISVNSIEDVNIGGAAASSGNFNVILVRGIVSSLPVFAANRGDVYGIDKLSNIPIDDNTFIQPVVISDGATSGAIRLDIEVSSA